MADLINYYIVYTYTYSYVLHHRSQYTHIHHTITSHTHTHMRLSTPPHTRTRTCTHTNTRTHMCTWKHTLIACTNRYLITIMLYLSPSSQYNGFDCCILPGENVCCSALLRYKVALVSSMLGIQFPPTMGCIGCAIKVVWLYCDTGINLRICMGLHSLLYIVALFEFHAYIYLRVCIMECRLSIIWFDIP